MKRYLLYLGLFSFLSALSGNVTDAERLAAVREEIATLEAQIDEWRSEFRLPEAKNVKIESLNAWDISLKEATELLKRDGTEVEFVLSEAAKHKVLHIRLRSLNLDRILEFLTQQINFVWVYHDNRVYIYDEDTANLSDELSEMVINKFNNRSKMRDLIKGDLQEARREERNIERTIPLVKCYKIELVDNKIKLLRGDRLVTKGMHHNGKVYFLYENVIDHSSDIGMPPDVPKSIYTTPLGNLYHWSPTLKLRVKSKSGVDGEPIYFTKFVRYKNDEGEFPVYSPDNEVKFSSKVASDCRSSNERRHHHSYDIIFHDVESLDGFLEKYINEDLVMVVYLYVDLPIEGDYLTDLINSINELQHPFYLVIKTSSVDNTTDSVSNLTRRYMDLKESYYDKTKAEWEELLLHDEDCTIKFRRRRSYLFKQGYDTEICYSFDDQRDKFKSVTFLDASDDHDIFDALYWYPDMRFYLYDDRYLRIHYDIRGKEDISKG